MSSSGKEGMDAQIESAVAVNEQNICSAKKTSKPKFNQDWFGHLGQDYSSFGVSMDIISVRNNLKQPKTEKTETETLALWTVG